MRCNDCNQSTNTRCTACTKPYCAACRRASGRVICLTCRSKKAAARQKAKLAQHIANPAQSPPAPLYTPVTVGTTANPPHLSTAAASRKPLEHMDDMDFEQWREETVAALRIAKQTTEAYTQRRVTQGMHTPTDALMLANIRLYDDLLTFFSQELPKLWFAVQFNTYTPPPVVHYEPPLSTDFAQDYPELKLQPKP